MNIKGVLGAIIPTQVRATEKVERGIKSDNSSADRDANGQMFQGEQQKKERPPMDDEQKKQALEHFKNMAVVKENNLTVQWHQADGRSFILLKDHTGKILRRVSEAELWDLKDAKENEKGQLLRRTA